MTKGDRIYDFLMRAGEGLTAREITDALYSPDTQQAIVFSKLQEMVAKGRLIKYGSSQPYRYAAKDINAPAILTPEKKTCLTEPLFFPPTKPLVSTGVSCPLLDSLNNFFSYITTSKVDIYNEFSLQHEMGIYLRELFSEYKVQFERNVSFFYAQANTIKKEIDIVLYNDSKGERYAIELKYPVNGQYPEQMYSFVKDIRFMEQLKEKGFTHTFAIALVRDKPFYQGSHNTGIYKYFREAHKVYGRIGKPTGNGKFDELVSLNGAYDIDWRNAGTNQKYYIVAI